MGAWTIALLTFREAGRRKIALAAILLGVAFLLLYNVGFYFLQQQFRAEARLDLIGVKSMVNFTLMAGLYTVNFLAIAMAALVSADTLAGEISSGSIQTIVAKPVRRYEVVLGKWLGFAGLLALYVLLMAGGLMVTTWMQSGYTPPRIPQGLALIYLEALIVMTVSLAASSRFSTLATGAVVFGLYGLAFVGSWVEQIGSFLENQTAIQIGIISSLFLPSEAVWRRASYEMTTSLVQMMAGGPFVSRSVPSPVMIVYAVLYLLAAFALAVHTFNRRDL